MYLGYGISGVSRTSALEELEFLDLDKGAEISESDLALFGSAMNPARNPPQFLKLLISADSVNHRIQASSVFIQDFSLPLYNS